MGTPATDNQSPSLTLTPAEQALAVEEIERVFARRLRIMDTKQWDLYGSVHTEDIVSESWGAGSRVTGRETLADTIRNTLDGKVFVTSVHHGHTPEIVLTSDTTATGIWAMEDELWWTNGDVEEHLHGYGHYHEEYRKVEGKWLISYRTLTRLRETATPNFYDYRGADTPRR
ncbi:nuclear transport factor 2 family protein [Rhodococcus hoagii]|uniref:nuclear transport factor 2 family protein n=1 Tax=Prescottella TaxID=2979332 RepID=UPI0009C0659F|nr:nuclear transport factor 2 family protein [Prescottella equi]NKR52216.1 nuclear transport factor 2 family protein [Prescottella equi]NKR64565.1 nuclear transport factor 2 family protein [Prescottella equi]NKR78696.1 nuclear transport factor 2 family protein [Prescottella equi]NKR96957.1 nuclear transport factor 2 family protein [Prescottella equi]NKT00830.1 nuclear transport factor 2 family protein [Prescottella equi]